jgi:hypothetical protein
MYPNSRNVSSCLKNFAIVASLVTAASLNMTGAAMAMESDECYRACVEAHISCIKRDGDPGDPYCTKGDRSCHAACYVKPPKPK